MQLYQEFSKPAQTIQGTIKNTRVQTDSNEGGGIWKERRICLYLIGNTGRMILNIIQNLFRRLGVGAPQKQRWRDGMEESQWQRVTDMWRRWQQLENRVLTASDTHKEWHGWSKMPSEEEECVSANIPRHCKKLRVLVSKFGDWIRQIQISTPGLWLQQIARDIKETPEALSGEHAGGCPCVAEVCRKCW